MPAAGCTKESSVGTHGLSGWKNDAVTDAPAGAVVSHCRERKACRLNQREIKRHSVCCGTGRQPSFVASKHQAMRYEKKRHVGTRDKTTSA
jgi:hypothetical protein